MITRDSASLWVGFGIAVVAFLGSAGNPAGWDFAKWVEFASVLLAWASGKLATSPLAGENDHLRVPHGV